MSFRFNWKFFDLDDLYATCKTAITESIATAKRPPEMTEPLRVVDIQFGQRPPELGLQTIPEVSEGRAHLVFKLKYEGDAEITLQSTVQANPLRVMLAASPTGLPAFLKPKIVGAESGLVLPFSIKVFGLELDTLVDVIYTKNGVVVSFRNNPVKGVRAETSLDQLPGVTQMINRVVKVALADTFQEDVPEVIYKSRSSTGNFPDPTFGARRACNQFVVHTKFLELGLAIRTPTVSRFYHTLSLSQGLVKHAIPARQCLAPAKERTRGTPSVRVHDILERSPEPDPAASSSPEARPDSSVLSIDSISHLAEARYQKRKRTPNRRVIKIRKPDETPPLTYSESPVFDSPPQPNWRRYSISDLDNFGHQHKIRTASLQPQPRPFNIPEPEKDKPDE